MQDFVQVVAAGDQDIAALRQTAEKFDGVYPQSLYCMDHAVFYLTKQADGQGKKMIIVEQQPSSIFDRFQGEKIAPVVGKRVKLAPLSHENALALRECFPFTAPVAFGKDGMSIGLGDRLGVASPGHIRLLAGRKVRPVLAQQSIRELNLTNRTYEDVLDAASWAVFQEGYELGFGADGDHLKNEAEVKMALDLGFSMITLDCSEQIDNQVLDKTDDEVAAAFSRLPEEDQRRIQPYLDQTFVVGTTKINFTAQHLQRVMLIYGQALHFIRRVYFDLIQKIDRPIDFEVSIDETLTPTLPQDHYFIAAELAKQKVDLSSMAPRFCGEFQKGIDYIGDIEQFEAEFKIHAAIADQFGYRLSIHSGSDKFKTFPIIGKYTEGRVHVKTAGTNWLEALKVIAAVDPALFRKIQTFALAHFTEATQYYHVTTDLTKIPDINQLSDAELPTLLEQNDARQVLHITYGLILNAKDVAGQPLFHDEFFQDLADHETLYYEKLGEHIGRHLDLLGCSVQ